MKNKKFKLFASLTSLVMVVAVMAVGVWAATAANTTISANVSFSASGILGTVTEGADGQTFLSIGQSTDNADVKDQSGSWNLTFEIDQSEDATLEGKQTTKTLRITNTGTNKLYYQVAPVGEAPTTDTVAAIKVEVTSGTGSIEGDAQTKYVDITITYTVVAHTGASFDQDTDGVTIQQLSVKLSNATIS